MPCVSESILRGNRVARRAGAGAAAGIGEGAPVRRADGKTSEPGRRRRPAPVTSEQEGLVLNGQQLSGYDSEYPSGQRGMAAQYLLANQKVLPH